jgi:hypothetical protein
MIHFPTTPDEFCNTHLRCSFGITEALGLGAAVGGGDLLAGLGSLFRIGEAAAAPAEAGLAATLPGADIASIIGSGEGLFVRRYPWARGYPGSRRLRPRHCRPRGRYGRTWRGRYSRRFPGGAGSFRLQFSCADALGVRRHNGDRCVRASFRGSKCQRRRTRWRDASAYPGFGVGARRCGGFAQRGAGRFQCRFGIGPGRSVRLS